MKLTDRKLWENAEKILCTKLITKINLYSTKIYQTTHSAFGGPVGTMVPTRGTQVRVPLSVGFGLRFLCIYWCRFSRTSNLFLGFSSRRWSVQTCQGIGEVPDRKSMQACYDSFVFRVFFMSYNPLPRSASIVKKEKKNLPSSQQTNRPMWFDSDAAR